MKNKWLASVLNVLPGLGYLYVGTRTPFAVLLLAYWVVAIAGGMIDPTWADLGSDIPSRGWDAVMIAATFLPFVVDAYFEAIRVNKEVSKATKKK
jgi:hypothetical protein